jgi:DNA primase
MTLELLESLIESDFGYKATNNWGKSEEHTSLVVDRRKNKWFWNSKGWSGSVIDYLMLVRGLNKNDALQYVKGLPSYNNPNSNETSLETPYEKLVGFLWENGKDRREYWYKRGFKDNIIDRFSLGFFNEWFTIPIYIDGIFKNFQCRREVPEKRIKSWYRGVGPLLFNSSILQFVTKVYITEGPTDAILLTQLGLPAVSHNAGAEGWKDEWFKYFLNIKSIVYIADNDRAGINASKKVSKSLGEGRVKVLRFSDKAEKYDTIDFFRDGGTTEEFLDREEHSKYSFEGEA